MNGNNSGSGSGVGGDDGQQLLHTPYTTHTLTSLEAMSSHNNNTGGGENGLLADKKKKSRAHLNNKDEQKGQNYDQYTGNNKLKRRNSDNEVDITLLNYAESLTSAAGAAGKGKGQNCDPSLHGSLEKKPRKYNKTGKYTSHIDDTTNNSTNNNSTSNNKYSYTSSSQVNSSDKGGKKLTKAALEKKVNNIYTYIHLPLIYSYTLIIILTLIPYHNYDLKKQAAEQLEQQIKQNTSRSSSSVPLKKRNIKDINNTSLNTTTHSHTTRSHSHPNTHNTTNNNNISTISHNTSYTNNTHTPYPTGLTPNLGLLGLEEQNGGLNTSGEHSIYGLEVSHFFDPSFSAMKFTPHHHRNTTNYNNSSDGGGNYNSSGGGVGSGDGEGCHRSPMHFLNQSGMSPGYFGLPTPLRKYISYTVIYNV